MHPFTLQTRIFDAITQAPLPGLRVEFWEHDRGEHDLLGIQTTDAQGVCRLGFEAEAFQDEFRERKPRVFLRIYQGDQLVHSTEDNPLRMEKGEAALLEVGVALSNQRAASPVWRLKGTVSDAHAQAIRGVQVWVYALDLLGLRNFSAIEEVQASMKQPGFQLLGKTETGREGQYELFVRLPRGWQGGSDIVEVGIWVTQSGNDRAGATILGRERLQLLENEASPVRPVIQDIILQADRYVSQVRYVQLKEQVTARLSGLGLNLGDLGESPEQLAFLARESGRSAEEVNWMVAAHIRSNQHDRPEQVEPLYFALASRGLSLAPQALIPYSRDELLKELHSASAEGVIPAFSSRKLANTVEQIVSQALRNQLTHPCGREALHRNRFSSWPHSTPWKIRYYC